MPFAGNALQWRDTTAAKAKARPGDEILHGARYQYFPGAGQRRDPRPDVDGDPADIIADDLAFARVQAGADIDAERPDFISDRSGATDPAGPSTVARNPSPVVLTSWPLKRVRMPRTMA